METIVIKSEVKCEDDFDDQFFTEEEIKVREVLFFFIIFEVL